MTYSRRLRLRAAHYVLHTSLEHFVELFERSNLFSSPDSACSLEGTRSQIVPLLACKLDITPHLLSLGVSSGQQRTGGENVNEVDLMNRAGHFVGTDNEEMSMTVCPRHR